MAAALPTLIKTGQRTGGVRLRRWRLFTRPVYEVAEHWTYRSRAVPALVIVIPAGFRTDLVSAPWWARWFLPLLHLAIAALVHDWLRENGHTLSLEEIDVLMLLVMTDTGVPDPSRTLVWLAVRTNNNRAKAHYTERG